MPSALAKIEQMVLKAVTALSAPKTAQDDVDRRAAELAVSDALRRHADRRYEAAKKSFMDEYAESVEKVRGHALEHMTKYTVYNVGVDWQVEITANTPQQRINVDELRTELVKSGVDIKLIDKCMNKVRKKSAPATIIKAHEMNSGEEAA